MNDDAIDSKKLSGSPEFQRKEFGSLRGTYKVGFDGFVILGKH
jgi:hypothetical protein